MSWTEILKATKKEIRDAERKWVQNTITDIDRHTPIKVQLSYQPNGRKGNVYIINDRDGNIPLFHEIKDYFKSMGRVEEIGERTFMVTERVF